MAMDPALDPLRGMDVIVSRPEFEVTREKPLGRLTIYRIRHLIAEAHESG